jgi:hypothetical protein
MTKIIEFGTARLVSTAAGVEYRELIMQSMLFDEKVELNLANVTFMSESFSYELFGVLALQVGQHELADNIHIVEASSSVLASIVTAIKRASWWTTPKKEECRSEHL